MSWLVWCEMVSINIPSRIRPFFFRRVDDEGTVLVGGLTSRPQAPRPGVNASSGDPRLVFIAGCAVLALPGHSCFSPFGLVVTMTFFSPNSTARAYLSQQRRTVQVPLLFSSCYDNSVFRGVFLLSNYYFGNRQVSKCPTYQDENLQDVFEFAW